MSGADPLSRALWVLGLALTIVAVGLTTRRLEAAASSTVVPFLVLGAVIAGAVVVDGLGLFGWASRMLTRSCSGVGLRMALLGFAAIVSAGVNLDVAVAVVVPTALRAVRHQGESGDLAIAVALTANAASFLLPTSNPSTLLVLSRAPMPPGAYIARSWIAWLMVTVYTVVTLGLLACRQRSTRRVIKAEHAARLRPSMLLDLIPMFACATAIRSLIGISGLVVSGGAVHAMAITTALDLAVNNLPAAAAVHPSGDASVWGAILGLAVGPNAFITASLASLIARKLAISEGAHFSITRFAFLGVLMVPAQLALADLGLHLSGAL
ncbi:MAG: hypothetical protein ABR498_04960 [Candidatus Dormibacteria bacterium]